MMTGRIAKREAILRLQVIDQNGAVVDVEAAIDTGFTGFVGLPAAVINAHSFDYLGQRQVTLGDGSLVALELYGAHVIWHGRRKLIILSTSNSGPVLGMALLEDSRLTMDVRDGGQVLIEPLP
jgi:clan AA aspartic protease